MARLRYNGLSTTLGAALTNSATAVTFAAALTHSGGTAVPTIAGSDYIPLTILDATGKVSEIVYLTAYTSGATTGTITRAQESTTGVAHASGDTVHHGPTVLDFTTTSGADAPLFARKSVNESVTSSTTLQDDDHLTLTLAANTTYRFEAMLLIYGTEDFKFQFKHAAAGWASYWFPVGPSTAIAAVEGDGRWDTAFGGSEVAMIRGSATLATPFGVLVVGTVTTDATGGAFKLQWAQNVSSTNASTLYKGSHLMAQKVA